jgi:hypothetical protein
MFLTDVSLPARVKEFGNLLEGKKNVSCLVRLNMNEMNSLALNVLCKRRRGEMDSRIINSFSVKKC